MRMTGSPMNSRRIKLNCQSHKDLKIEFSFDSSALNLIGRVEDEDLEI
jgi:hypothetical protein